MLRKIGGRNVSMFVLVIAFMHADQLRA
jgi:hypothetical protein